MFIISTEFVYKTPIMCSKIKKKFRDLILLFFFTKTHSITLLSNLKHDNKYIERTLL